ncbi:MAG: 4Fe-4S binding protein [Candidatus Sumerlaeia bacterium]
MSDKKISRKNFLTLCGRTAGGLILGGTAIGLTMKGIAQGSKEGTVWQIDPDKCSQCGQCATHCVLDQSAVKCFHYFPMCGYCDLCTGFFEAEPNALTEAAENQLCPVNALDRRFAEDPYFEYNVDEDRCNACGKCVKGCTQFGNGSLYLQVNHGLCVNCNECNIAVNCPADAFRRVPANDPYIPRIPEAKGKMPKEEA